MSGVLLDTCVLIDCLRNRPAAVDFLRRIEGPPSVSVVTVAELLAGARNESEELGIDSLLAPILIRSIDLATARLAGRFSREYRHSHAVEMPDALIAAAAKVHGARLVTRNVRHFPMLDDLIVPYH
jgi:predicted nucleic acid-binding protein